jgi:hypothetical protein
MVSTAHPPSRIADKTPTQPMRAPQDQSPLVSPFFRTGGAYAPSAKVRCNATRHRDILLGRVFTTSGFRTLRHASNFCQL